MGGRGLGWGAKAREGARLAKGLGGQPLLVLVFAPHLSHPVLGPFRGRVRSPAGHASSGASGKDTCVVDTGRRALRCFSRTRSCHSGSSGPILGSGFPSALTGQRSPPWLCPPPPGGHTDLAAAQLESAWPVRVRAPGQAIPMPDRVEVGGAAWELRKETPRGTRRPGAETFWSAAQIHTQLHCSGGCHISLVPLQSRDHVCLACAGWPGMQGAPRYSPCHPAMPVQGQRGDRSERPEPSVEWERERRPPQEEAGAPGRQARRREQDVGREGSLTGVPDSRHSRCPGGVPGSRDPRGTGAQGRSHGSLDVTLRPQAPEDR